MYGCGLLLESSCLGLTLETYLHTRGHINFLVSCVIVLYSVSL